MTERFAFPHGPQRIVCMTEETTEWLYLLGQEQRIVGISGYTVRPRRAREEKPRVSAFTSAKIDKILELQPDCVFGFSDMQADIAAALIRQGVQVTVFNQRSVAEIFAMMFQVAAMVGQGERGLALIGVIQQQLAAIVDAVAHLPRRPRIFFEEWDEPHISAIRWVSELMGMAGGDDCFPELAAQSLGKNRIIADGAEIVRRNPDIIIGSWCGKKFRPEKVAARPGWENVNAVKNRQLFEIKSADILQPGPAALTDGVAQLHRIVLDWSRNVAPTLATSCAALPPEGVVPCLGRPGAAACAPTLATSCAALPPEGAASPWGGPAVKLVAPTLVTACTALPPEGAASPWGGPAVKLVAPTLATSCAALPPEGAIRALGRPGGAEDVK